MDRRAKLCLILAVILAVLALLVALWALFFRNPASDPTPDVAPPVEDNILPTDEDDQEKLPQAQGGGAVNITYSDQVSLSLSEGTVTLQFMNPVRSNQSMVLQVTLQEEIIAQSGSLPPGSQINTLSLIQELSLAPGSYQGTFHVLFYNTDDGSRALVSTEIPITITVSQ